eukprot:gnl/TRDRNA2_/TRDRNA2_78333_c0_seq2.p1 gnl/TRDRNA2_/TRDRNA2_78333_c0~~gnl/TRDRNA2_/TRDRNA2_78333_c0_seq2.p1  ORF type:complete len:112 (-),score=6.49 gnl/TRDRNA2_/TRDRNA2_78333_c0_seq2:9-344(-)
MSEPGVVVSAFEQQIIGGCRTSFLSSHCSFESENDASRYILDTHSRKSMLMCCMCYAAAQMTLSTSKFQAFRGIGKHDSRSIAVRIARSPLSHYLFRARHRDLKISNDRTH